MLIPNKYVAACDHTINHEVACRVVLSSGLVSMDLGGRESCVDDDGLSLATKREEAYYSLAMSNISNALHAVHDLAVVEQCNTDGPARENNARNPASPLKPLDKSHPSCLQEVPKILTPPVDKEMQTLVPTPHGNQR